MGTDLKRLEADLLAQSPDLDLDPSRHAPFAGAETGRSTVATVPPAPQPGPRSAPGPGAAGAGARPAVDVVGRTHELAVLQDALTDSAGGRGSIVVLVGEPGIGKTRLAESVVEAAGAVRVRRGLGPVPREPRDATVLGR